ncbi:hypothetical protein CPR19092_LGOLGGFK_01665 [Companilactobacillus paralimentarius]|uniref:hypothetical protein n=1 Tax=Companilactobacillus paralimentarius TaxID=83526 RepID=UPI00384D6E61
MNEQHKKKYQVKYITARDIGADYTDDNSSRAKKTERYINDVCSVLIDNDCNVLDIENAHSFLIIIKYTQPIE